MPVDIYWIHVAHAVLQECTDVFSSGGGKNLADEIKCPFLGLGCTCKSLAYSVAGQIPLDMTLGACSDEGESFLNKAAQSGAFENVKAMVEKLVAGVEKKGSDDGPPVMES